MSVEVSQIDWRPEFKRLRAMIQSRGGIVRISHAGEICAWRRFDAVLKATFADVHKQSVSIRIDSHWHTTRFLADILTEFDRKLTEAALPYTMAPSKVARGDVAVLSGNVIDGNAEFNVGTVNLGASAADQVRNREAAVLEICQRCEALLARGDRLMVVVHHGNEEEQSAFWRDLWQRGLRNLTLRGMLLIHYVEEGAAVHGNAPDPDEEFSLPRDLADENREGDAYDDLIDMLMTLNLGKDTASGMAMAHINSNKRSMNSFYNNLTSLVMKVQRAKQ